MEEEINYQEFVKTLLKPGEDILHSLTPQDCNLVHLAMGIAGEAGELLDAFKKAVMYRKILDRTNVIEELGDIEFFLEGIRTELGVSRDYVISQNIKKLEGRYKEGKYSDQQAQDRADKQQA